MQFICLLTKHACSQTLCVQPFHGEKEVFTSTHKDTVHKNTIMGRCRVHSLKQYEVSGGSPALPELLGHCVGHFLQGLATCISEVDWDMSKQYWRKLALRLWH
jgi:hypothetical protein